MATATLTLEIPCSYVVENGEQADATVVGGTTALQTNDGDTSYAEGIATPTTLAAAYFRFRLPATELPGPVESAQMVAVGKLLTGGDTGDNPRASLGLIDDSGNLQYVTFMGSNSSPTPTAFDTADYTEIALPISGLWDHTIASGTGSYLGNLYLEDCRLTYLAMRVQCREATPTSQRPVYNRIVQRGNDGLGASGGRRIIQNRSRQSTNRRGASFW